MVKSMDMEQLEGADEDHICAELRKVVTAMFSVNLILP